MRALEDRLAGRVGFGQHGGVDVNHDLVALAGRAGIQAIMKRILRNQREGVRLPLAPGRHVFGYEKSGARSRWNVRTRSRGSVRPAALIQRISCCRQRLHQHGSCLGLQPSADDDHAVFVLIHLQ